MQSKLPPSAAPGRRPERFTLLVLSLQKLAASSSGPEETGRNVAPAAEIAPTQPVLSAPEVVVVDVVITETTRSRVLQLLLVR